MSADSPTYAGAYLAVGVDLQGIAPKQFEQLQVELEATKAQLEEENLDGLTKHDLTGAIMQTGVLGYFGMTYAQDKLAAQLQNAVTYRTPSYGTFGIAPTVSYWFGLPRDIKFAGVGMDIDRLGFATEVGNNCYVDWTTLNRASAARASAFEHLIPEMLFANTSQTNSEGSAQGSPQGVSAVKALQVAAQQGQKIFTLTQTNIDQLNNISIDSATKNEIRNAISQGKTVQVHEREINYFGWSGSGYIIENPETGSGAYKITGGANGAILIVLGLLVLFLLGIKIFLLGGVVLTAVMSAALVAFVNAALAMIALGISLVAESLGQKLIADVACAFSWVFIGGSIGGLLAFFLPAVGIIGSSIVSEAIGVIAIFSQCSIL
ncbi:hypothetical protein [Pelagibaculum spongiae]|nr:hypothetical protein [Pelagibaculum spongiae]